MNEGKAFKPNCGSQSLQLTISTNHPVFDEFGKVKAGDVTAIFITNKVSTLDSSSMKQTTVLKYVNN